MLVCIELKDRDPCVGFVRGITCYVSVMSSSQMNGFSS